MLSRLALALAVLAALMLAVSGPGARLGTWDFRFGFQLMRWAAWGAGAAAVLAVVALLVPRVRARGVVLPAAALVLALAVLWVPWSLVRQARAVPAIHDISTDLANPPAFVAVAPLRADAPNPVEYAGPEAAAKQREAYPDVQPLDLDVPPAVAFERAMTAARDMGWELVAAEAAEGRIEATATTRWFGFKDDVVVRVLPRGEGGSRVDVRSKSRVGGSDVGANAARIRRYLAAVRSQG